MLTVGVLVGSTPAALAVRSGVLFQANSSDERVSKLFGSMRSGKLNSVDFPDVGWQDIPALLKVAESTKMVTCFPRNPLSSQLEQKCSEGMIALWLIEGVRRGGKRFPALNALIGPLGNGSNWEEVSENHHPKALAAYRTWWMHAQHLKKEQAAKIDPLKGTGLVWYGAGL